MNKKMLIVFIWGIILSSKLYAEVNVIEQNWRYPDTGDLKWDWKEYQEVDPEPYHISGDFNGDGQKDHAWILIGIKNPNAWRLYVFLTKNNDDVQRINLDESYEKIPAQGYGLKKFPPGIYRTVCDKGYGNDSNCKAREVDIKNDSISLYRYESGGRIFYYDDMVFKSIWESD
jgi:hypothetical protein